MKAFWPRLPILAKDLVEQAARRRTYIVRFVYALVLFVAACALIYANVGLSAEAGHSLGRGRAYFTGLIEFQLAALFVIVPMVTAGAITEEKQRDTLVLLLLTTLTPWQIVFQKFAGRMTPILSFVCLSFPLLAVTYTFGGVTIDELVVGIMVQVFACLALGAFAIMCSAFFRSTSQAVAATYLGCFFPGFEYAAYYGLLPSEPAPLYASAVVIAGFSLFAIVGCLSLAEAAVAGRGSARVRNFLLASFAWIDRQLEVVNGAAGRIVLVRDRGALPHRAPIRWRETRIKCLGTFRYLVRILLAIEIPILFANQLIHRRAGDNADGYLSLLLAALWIASIVLIAVQAAGLIPEERSRRTLSVLLSSPLSGRQILADKAAGVHRLTAILSIPLLTIFAFEQWWHSPGPLDYFILAALTVLAYLPTVEWLALGIGLRSRSQLPAIAVALSIVVSWTAGLALVLPLLRQFQIEPGRWSEVVLAVSPIDMIWAVEGTLPPVGEAGGTGATSFGTSSPWARAPLATSIHFVFYLSLLAFLRWRCRRNVDLRLGRIPQPGKARRQKTHDRRKQEWVVRFSGISAVPGCGLR